MLKINVFFRLPVVVLVSISDGDDVDSVVGTARPRVEHISLELTF